MWVALMIWPVVLGACADTGSTVSQSSPSPSRGIPSRLDIVCHADGSTELQNEEVQASPDGVHIRVDNRAGESVSINGAGLDFAEGVTEQVASSAPGELKVACWPGSMHAGPEPDRLAIQIHDPESYWIPSELECPKDELVASATLDYVSDSVGTKGDPVEIAREKVKGIEADDGILTVGYREAEYRQVAVERDGVTIALLSYSPAQEGSWLLAGYSACDSAGIRV